LHSNAADEEVEYDGPWLYESGVLYDDPKANIYLIEENFQHWREKFRTGYS